MNIFSFRLRFSKTGKLRFLSHHDTMRMFERALRRTELPLRMTEGYNPHPILSFPTALGLGIESVDEILELELSSWVAPLQLQDRIGEQLPEGIDIVSAETFDRRRRSRVDFVEYEAVCPGQVEGLGEAIPKFLAFAEFPVKRVSDKGSKVVEIRQYVMAIETDGDRVLFRIKVTDQGTARPDEVLRAIGLNVDSTVRMRKTYTEVGTRK